MTSDGEPIPFWDRWAYEGRDPYLWEAEKRPPYPWEAASWELAYGGKQDGSLLVASGEGTSSLQSDPSCVGFYKVVRTGVHLIGLTNGIALSGIVQVPVEAGYHTGTLSSVTLSANASAIEGTPMLAQPFSSPLTFPFDTRRLANGTYSIEASGLWTVPFANDFDTGYTELKSPSVLVNVYNPIFYPDWVQDYRDDLLIIRVSSAEASFDWQIDIYGEAEDYIGSFTGHSDNGMVDFAWDLRDPGGNSRTDNQFFSQTTVTPTGPALAAAVTQTNPPLIKVVDNYPDQGMWIVARTDYIPSSVENYEYYLGAVNAFAQMGESAGGVLPGEPYHASGEALFLYRGEQSIQSAAMFRSFTNRNVRNFYWDGHGGPGFIGYGYDANNNKREFAASEVKNWVGNSTPGTNNTRYRWVFLDSCKSALGAWPATFALGNKENVPLGDYTSRPGAFCGFAEDVYGWSHGSFSIDIRAINYRTEFLVAWWLQEFPLKLAFDQAASRSGFPQAYLLRVYGYWGLHWNEFNTKGEWPP